MNHRLMSNNHSRRPDRVLHVGTPNVGDRKIFDRLVDEMFEQRWLTNNGPLVQRFEKQLSEFLGVKHCIAVCNATTGLQLACRALELTGEVIVPAYTFVATAHAMGWVGVKPVFADVKIDTHSLCPESVLSQINDQTTAILGVHLWGRPCDIEGLQRIAECHQLRLLFDAAHAFSCSHQGRMIGNFGECEVFSFHATKFFNTFEGGAITTNNDDLAERIRVMANFGFSGVDGVIELGTNAKLPEVSAAMGLSMFGRIGQFAEKNRQNYQLYESLLGDVPGVDLLSFEAIEQTNWQYVVVLINENEFGVSRDRVHQYLQQNGILAKRYFHPGCHRVSPYRADFLVEGRKLPNTDALCQSVLCLPTGTTIESEDIIRVCQALQSVGASKLGNLSAYESKKAAG